MICSAKQKAGAYPTLLPTPPPPNNNLKDRAATVIQRTFRRYKDGYSILQSYSDNNPACLFGKRSVPLIRTVSVLKAITSFKKLRIQRKYLDNDQIDMVDVGLKTLDIQTDVSRLNARMDRMEYRAVLD